MGYQLNILKNLAFSKVFCFSEIKEKENGKTVD